MIRAAILMITPIRVSQSFEQKAWKFMPSKVLFTWRYLVEEVNPNHKLQAKGLCAYNNYTQTCGLSINYGFNFYKFSECFIKSILIIFTCPTILSSTPASLLIKLQCCHYFCFYILQDQVVLYKYYQMNHFLSEHGQLTMAQILRENCLPLFQHQTTALWLGMAWHS